MTAFFERERSGAEESKRAAALASSPIADAFLGNGMGSEAFLEALNERIKDLHDRHPRYDLRMIRQLATFGDVFAILEEHNEEVETLDQYNARTERHLEALFLIGYELGSDENIEALFDELFEKTKKCGMFSDEVESDEMEEDIASRFFHATIYIGSNYRNLDDTQAITQKDPPVIKRKRSDTDAKLARILRGVSLD